MFQFLPEEERFIAYPLPTCDAFLRDVIFTPQGWVCARPAVGSPSPWLSKAACRKSSASIQIPMLDSMSPTPKSGMGLHKFRNSRTAGGTEWSQ